MSKKEIVKSDVLAGGIGTMSVNGLTRDITAIKTNVNGSVTLTIGAIKKHEIVTEDAECEVVPNTPKLIQ